MNENGCMQARIRKEEVYLITLEAESWGNYLSGPLIAPLQVVWQGLLI